MTDDPIYQEAFGQLTKWLQEAKKLDLREPDAATLATAGKDGRVTARVVLVRRVEPEGLVFFTNSRSVKGRQLAENPRAALCYYWDATGHQVRVEGEAHPIAPEESDAYWATRPRDAQLGSAVSRQSEVLESREAFIQEVLALEARLQGRPVPRPEHWFGYRLQPDQIEFFINRPARMHERTVYLKTPRGWRREWRYP